MQKEISYLYSESSYCSISFLEALLSLVTILVSSSSSYTALRDVGLMPTLLPLLKDLDPQHIHLVTSIVHALEASKDYSNLVATSFRDLGGLDSNIARNCWLLWIHSARFLMLDTCKRILYGV